MSGLGQEMALGCCPDCIEGPRTCGCPERRFALALECWNAEMAFQRERNKLILVRAERLVFYLEEQFDEVANEAESTARWFPLKDALDIQRLLNGEPLADVYPIAEMEQT